eukprot:gene40045-52884_t
MAGVTDRPFRQLCKQFGAGYAVSEMVTSRPDLWDSLKTSRRANHDGEPGPIAVQIAGTEAQMMADAARYNIDRGAQIIDINMGCPAKKVCNKWAGSALMQDEKLALEIISAVVQAAQAQAVPVTLKMRTGWCDAEKNALSLARAAESAGVQMVTVHGRTREQGYSGWAEYDTVAAVKAALRIPVVANGDITSPEKARDVLANTGADAIMIGRAAQGRPWIFREIAHFLDTGEHLAPPLVAEVRRLLLRALIPGDADVAYDTRFIDHFLADDVLALASASSVYDWKPDVPVRLYHGRDDRTVPYASSVSTRRAMQERGAGDLISLTECRAQPVAGHLQCVPPFITFMLGQLAPVAQDL